MGSEHSTRRPDKTGREGRYEDPAAQVVTAVTLLACRAGWPAPSVADLLRPRRQGIFLPKPGALLPTINHSPAHLFEVVQVALSILGVIHAVRSAPRLEAGKNLVGIVFGEGTQGRDLVLKQVD